MKKLNWDLNCHFVVDICRTPFIADIHTHGLKDEIGTELQFALFKGEEFMDETRCLFGQVANEILNENLSIDDETEFTLESWSDCKFRLFKTKDYEGNDIVRIIECDMNGRFPDNEECAFPFLLQCEDIYSIDELIQAEEDE